MKVLVQYIHDVHILQKKGMCRITTHKEAAA